MSKGRFGRLQLRLSKELSTASIRSHRKRLFVYYAMSERRCGFMLQILYADLPTSSIRDRGSSTLRGVP